jgi:arsenate reductase (thioredoxin)
MDDGRTRVLFLGTHCAARAVMAEALLKMLGKGRFRAYSAGSHPYDGVHPLTAELLGRLGFVEEDFQPWCWSAYFGPGAPEMRLVITVSGSGKGVENLPWQGQPAFAHWPIADPLADRSEDVSARRAAFLKAFRRVHDLVQALVALPVEDMSRSELQNAVNNIGLRRFESRAVPLAADLPGWLLGEG